MKQSIPCALLILVQYSFEERRPPDPKPVVAPKPVDPLEKAESQRTSAIPQVLGLRHHVVRFMSSSASTRRAGAWEPVTRISMESC